MLHSPFFSPFPFQVLLSFHFILNFLPWLASWAFGGCSKGCLYYSHSTLSNCCASHNNNNQQYYLKPLHSKFKPPPSPPAITATNYHYHQNRHIMNIFPTSRHTITDFLLLPIFPLFLITRPCHSFPALCRSFSRPFRNLPPLLLSHYTLAQPCPALPPFPRRQCHRCHGPTSSMYPASSTPSRLSLLTAVGEHAVKRKKPKNMRCNQAEQEEPKIREAIKTGRRRI